MWNDRFHNFMIDIEFRRCNSDQCLYVKFQGNTECYILLYVDDLLIVSNDMQIIHKVKKSMINEFEITDIGNIDIFLGMYAERDETERWDTAKHFI